jgi:prolipoprotein diacylglyceryltransferase
MLDHPRLIYDWFSTTLLRWSADGLVVYDRWVINFSGIGPWAGGDGEVLLDFYYFCYLIAFVGVLFWFWKFRRQGWIKVKPHVPYDAMLLAMLGVLVGAKTAYIFIYNPDFYFGPPPYGPIDTADQLRRIFLNWSGMASHGAAAGLVAVSFIWYFYSGRKLPVAHIGDIGGISGAFGAIWIRLANFMNGELYGREAPEWLPWAMRFPVNSGKGNSVVQLNGELYERIPKPDKEEHYEAWITALRESNPGGVIETAGDHVLFKNPDAYLQSYEVMYRGAEGMQTYAPDAVPDDLGWRVLEVITTPRHPSQLYQMLLEGVLLLILLLWVRGRVKRAGVVFATFFAGYPIARFIGEFFRQPDVQFQQAGNELGTVFMGLSMGQLLSLGMATAGVCLVLYFWKFGKVIADLPMYPPDKPSDKGDDHDDDKEVRLKVPFEKDSGGSSGAGDIAGISELRKSLAEQDAKGQVGEDTDEVAEHHERTQTPPSLNVPFDENAEGGSGAGDIAGLPELREELRRKKDKPEGEDDDPGDRNNDPEKSE